MNIRAAKFVQSLRGLSQSEVAVALNMAVHADYKDCQADMSMTRLAAESGLQHRQTASLVVKRLDEIYGIVRAVGAKSGGRRSTVYTFTFTVNSNCGVTVEEPVNRNLPVAVDSANRNSGNTEATPNRNSEQGQPQLSKGSTATGELHEGVKGSKEIQRKKGKAARSLASDSKQNLGQEEITTLTDYVLERAFAESGGKLTQTAKQRAAIAKAVAKYKPTPDQVKIVVERFAAGCDTDKDFSYACPKFAVTIGPAFAAQIAKEIADAKQADIVAKSLEAGEADRRAARDAVAERIREEEELAEALGDSPF